jgi:hypothetical protein
MVLSPHQRTFALVERGGLPVEKPNYRRRRLLCSNPNRPCCHPHRRARREIRAGLVSASAGCEHLRDTLAPHRPLRTQWSRRRAEALRISAATQEILEQTMGGRIRLASIALVGLGVGLAHAEPLRIRAAWVAPISDWISIWLDKKDLAVHYGKSYVLESVHYNGTPPMITGMANGELEIAMLAFSTFPIAVVNAGMDDMRVIADEFQDGVEGYYSDEFMVLKDGPIKKVEDLKGKVVDGGGQRTAWT